MANSIKKIAIIGSGPSGVIAADYLLHHSNFKIDLIDAGITSESKVRIKNDGLIPKKTLFGNGFIYERLDSIKFIFDRQTSFDTSHAKGGLSNVWGANISALHKKYSTHWGINPNTLNKSLKYVLTRIPVCARNDMIDDDYDVSINTKHVIVDGISFDHTNFSLPDKRMLSKNNIAIGASKLAINVGQCIRCEKCMDGCIKNAIFNSAHLLPSLQQSTRFKYKPNYLLKKFKEGKNKVTIYISEKGSKKEIVLDYDLIIIATGVIDTTRIVHKSLNLKSGFVVKESKKYYLPFISSKFFSRTKTSNSISLSHIFIQNLEKSSMLHCQLYSSFHLLDYILRNKIGKFMLLLLWPFKFFLKYIYVGMIYLDSEDSGTLIVKEAKNKIMIKGEESTISRERLNLFIKRMRKIRKISDLTMIPIILGSKLGHSQHFGGTMPMKLNPKRNETDFLGRPFNHKKVFIVDSSILPSIPATPTTLTVMANAVRICQAIINQKLPSE